MVGVPAEICTGSSKIRVHIDALPLRPNCCGQTSCHLNPHTSTGCWPKYEPTDNFFKLVSRCVCTLVQVTTHFFHSTLYDQNVYFEGKIWYVVFLLWCLRYGSLRYQNASVCRILTVTDREVCSWPWQYFALGKADVFQLKIYLKCSRVSFAFNIIQLFSMMFCAVRAV